ncbi:unnamed protein product, partial [Timema podura]|nr:unnamed protein product [Timema podura]
MGVVVQQMVPAQSAGVLFTRHPVTGDPRQILITANYGLGESVVSAHVEPDTILLNRGTGNKITIKEIVCGKKAHKTTMTGLLELLFRKVPMDYTKEDPNVYKSLLRETNVNRFMNKLYRHFKSRMG